MESSCQLFWRHWGLHLVLKGWCQAALPGPTQSLEPPLCPARAQGSLSAPWHLHVQGNKRHNPHSLTAQGLTLSCSFAWPILQWASKYSKKFFHLFFLFFPTSYNPTLVAISTHYRPESLLGSAFTDNKCQHHKPHVNRPLTLYPQDPLFLHRTLAINVP